MFFTVVTASTDLDAVLATGPQCAVYTAMADNRLPDAPDDYRRILAAGVNVVGSSAVFLQYPWQVLPKELLAPIEDAAREGNSSLFVNGIDPGFANDRLPLVLTGMSGGSSRSAARRSWTTPPTTAHRPVRRDGIRQAARLHPDVAATRHPREGIGGAPTRRGPGRGARPGTQRHERVPAPEAFEIVSGHIPEGTAAAVRFEMRGAVDGKRASSSNTSPGCVTTWAPTGRSPPARWLLPDRDHRRTVLRHRRLPEQSERRSQSCGSGGDGDRAPATPSPPSLLLPPGSAPRWTCR